MRTKSTWLAHLASAWKWEDECYFFTNLNPRIRIMLAADTTTLKDAKHAIAPGGQLNGTFPLAWFHEFDGARVFHTSLGHKSAYYSDPDFRRHLLGGLRWVVGHTNTTTNPNPP